MTARRRAENLEKVPVAITVLQQSTFDRAGVFSAPKLTEVTPGLHVNPTTGDRNFLVYTIRGQGQTYGTDYPSVLSYFAEVPLARLSTGQFYDLANVQVLKGPQGTLFGKVTDGGAVLVTPQRPTDTFDGYAQVKLGDYNLQDFEGAVNVPLVGDKVLLRGAMQVTRRDGYTYNATSHVYQDDQSFESYRLSMIVRPFDGFENYTVGSYYHAHDHGTGNPVFYVNPTILAATLSSFGLQGLVPEIADEVNKTNPRLTFQDNQPLSRRRTYFLSNATTWNVADNITLKNIFGYVNIREQSPIDFDGTSFPLIESSESPFPFYYTKQLSEEFQIQGKSLDSKLDWVAGVYFDHLKPGKDQENLVNELFVLKRTQTETNREWSRAAFAQGTYDLSNLLQGLKLNGGIRYTSITNRSQTSQALILVPLNALLCTTTTVPGGPLAHPDAVTPPDCSDPFKDKEHAFTWQAGVDWQVDPSTLLYVTTRKGFKGGGFNYTYTALSQAHYKPEYIQDEEIGLKKDFHLDTVSGRVNLAAFHARETNIQRLVTYVEANGSPDSYVSNAAKATVQGVEFDGTLIPFKGLTLSAKYAYTDAKYDKKNADVLCGPPVAGAAVFCPLNKLAYTPKHQLTLDAHYTFPIGDSGDQTFSFGGGLFYQSSIALGDVSYVSANVTGNPYLTTEPGYKLVNLDATWTHAFGGPVDLGFFMNNVTNKVYRVGSNDLGYDFGTASGIYGEPRMFGFSVKFHWKDGRPGA